jgi:hypothetical protein
LELPGLPIEGMPEPIKVKINFDAGAVDQMIERRLVLRMQMLPKPAPARKRNWQSAEEPSWVAVSGLI